MVPLTRGKWAVVDVGDWEAVAGYLWSAAKARHTYYAVRSTDQDGRKVQITMHRQVFGIPNPDHRNRNGLDNRRSNLRACTHETNAQNRRPLPHSSQYK